MKKINKFFESSEFIIGKTVWGSIKSGFGLEVFGFELHKASALWPVPVVEPLFAES
jgi:hypothetical protein